MIPTLPVELTGQSPAVLRARERVRRVAAIEGGVLLVAEDGVDTPAVAREIHDRSRAAAHRFEALSCADADESALEETLFGTSACHDTDLVAVAPYSVFARARGGTLFLSDVARLSAALQARLARLARDGEMRLAEATVPMNVRLIASATPSIDEEVEANRLRHDLFRVLTVSRVPLPALRDRAADIPILADRVLAETCAAEGLTRRSFTQEAGAMLAARKWPGNLREFRAAILAIVHSTEAVMLAVEHLPPVLRIQHAAPHFPPNATLREARYQFEREYIASVLQYHGGHLGAAARTLGIQRPNLYRKARQLGIRLPKRSA